MDEDIFGYVLYTFCFAVFWALSVYDNEEALVIMHLAC